MTFQAIDSRLGVPKALTKCMPSSASGDGLNLAVRSWSLRIKCNQPPNIGYAQNRQFMAEPLECGCFGTALVVSLGSTDFRDTGRSWLPLRSLPQNRS